MAGPGLLKRMVTAGIALDILLIAVVLITGGFKMRLPWFTIRVHGLTNPLLILALLCLLRLLISTDWKKVVLLLSSLLMTLLVLEAGMRVFSVVMHRKSLAGLRNSREITHPPRGGKKISLGDFIQTSVNPDIVYELVPGVSARFLGKKLTINRYGFRGTAYPPRSDPHVVRIVGIGDSIMFGWGVADAETYLSVLERKLSAACPGTRWEIINAAVPGYNTFMEVATLKARLLAYAPDLVIIDYVGNDQELPNFLQKQISPYSLRHLFLLDYVRAKIDGLPWRGLDRLVDAPRDPFGRSFAGDRDKVPPAYRQMVGLDAVLKSLDKLKRLSMEHGFAVLVFSTTTITGSLRRHIGKLGFPILEARIWSLGSGHRRPCSGDRAVTAACRRFDHWLAGTGIHSYRDSPLTIGATDPHPSAMAHRALGGLLFDYLKNSGWVDTRCAKSKVSLQELPHKFAKHLGRIHVHEVAGAIHHDRL